MDWTLVIIAVLVMGALLLVLKYVTSRTQAEQPLPYRAKKYFFSRSEQEFLRLLNESMDRHKYTIFPKVRLADFMEVTESGPESQTWWNKIKSKHVDFLVWDVLQSKIALAVELDGSSHKTEKAMITDAFKDRLYDQVEIKLVRVDAGANLVQQVGEIKALLEGHPVETTV